MRRMCGLIGAVVLVMVLGSQARAQILVGDDSGLGTYVRYTSAGPGFGGYGFDYVQTVPSNSYVLDRWWMVTETPTVGTVPPPAATAQARRVAQVAPAPRVARAGRRVGSPGAARASTVRWTYSYPLPTGSLSWPGAGAVSFYSPAQRYESYDSGYTRSPYGSINYGMAYKGYSLGE
jgi:hypothetical protein